jgi:hypothetical protein
MSVRPAVTESREGSKFARNALRHSPLPIGARRFPLVVKQKKIWLGAAPHGHGQLKPPTQLRFTGSVPAIVVAAELHSG